MVEQLGALTALPQDPGSDPSTHILPVTPRSDTLSLSQSHTHTHTHTHRQNINVHKIKVNKLN
jgi:hypothetical protein